MTDAQAAKGHTALLPCPFCGGEAHFGKTTYSRPLADCRWAEDDEPVSEAHSVNCVSCAASNRNTIAGGYRTPEKAAEQWNTRVNKGPAADAMAEHLAYAVKLLRPFGHSAQVQAMENALAAYRGEA